MKIINDRAKILRLRTSIKLEEAPYIVIDMIGGKYDNVLDLLVEEAGNKNLDADVKPRINLFNGEIIHPVDSSTTTVKTANLLAWLEIKSALVKAMPQTTPIAVVVSVADQQNIAGESAKDATDTGRDAPTGEQDKPVPIIQQRCAVILNWLATNKHDPLNIPAPLKNGLATVKADCRKELCKNKMMFSSRSLFDKAWQQLRDDKKVKEQE